MSLEELRERAIISLTTNVEEYEQIEEIKGSCPKCGGPLEFREHVYVFDKEGVLRSRGFIRDPYCPSCKLFWLGQEALE